MRRILNGIYIGSGYLAGLSIVTLTAVVLAQIAGRLLYIRVHSVTQLTGYLMCTTIFLGLAYTLSQGGHIRVDLIIVHFNKRARWWAELAVLLVSLMITGYLAVAVVDLAWESFVTGDRSDGTLAIPYAIPQGAMAIGVIILFIRLIDEIVYLVRTGTPAHLKHQSGNL